MSGFEFGDGALYRSDAMARGVTDGQLRRAVKRHEAQRVWQGAYLPAEDTSSPTTGSTYTDRLRRHRQIVVAAARHGTDVRTVSHTSAGVLHGVPMLWPDLSLVHFISATTGRTTARGVIHRSRLARDDITEMDGIPVTTLTRTVCDIARLGDLRQALCVLDSGLHLGVRADEIDECAGRLARHPGIAMLRAAALLADGRSESVGESLSRLVLGECPLIPAPDLQVEVSITVRGRTKTVWCDFGWRDDDGVLRVVGEFDGRLKYHRASPFGERLPEEVIYDEKRREDGIRHPGSRPRRGAVDLVGRAASGRAPAPQGRRHPPRPRHLPVTPPPCPPRDPALDAALFVRCDGSMWRITTIPPRETHAVAGRGGGYILPSRSLVAITATWVRRCMSSLARMRDT
ncbi:hypothetical protein ACWDTI_17315 [Gordonia sp. NPDC003424]